MERASSLGFEGFLARPLPIIGRRGVGSYPVRTFTRRSPQCPGVEVAAISANGKKWGKWAKMVENGEKRSG